MRVRGLKYLTGMTLELTKKSHRAGAWIEILLNSPLQIISYVAPVRVRELKFYGLASQGYSRVAPVRVRGLKYSSKHPTQAETPTSHPCGCVD